MHLNVPAGPIEMPSKPLRVLVFHENRHIVAQCLEYDIAVQGLSLPELGSRLAHALATHVLIDLHKGREPLSQVQKAPDAFWTAWHNASRLEAPPVPASTAPAVAAASRVVRESQFAMS